LWTPRGIDAWIAVLGILKAGAAYLPLDAGLPAERLAYMIADAGCRVVVASRSATARIGGVIEGVAVVVVDDAQHARPPEVEVRPDDLAYVMYTSGSTGRPKGVGGTHRGMFHRC